MVFDSESLQALVAFREMARQFVPLKASSVGTVVGSAELRGPLIAGREIGRAHV